MAEKEDDSVYVIKTKFADKHDFVYVEKRNLSFENFCVNGTYILSLFFYF